MVDGGKYVVWHNDPSDNKGWRVLMECDSYDEAQKAVNLKLVPVDEHAVYMFRIERVG